MHCRQVRKTLDSYSRGELAAFLSESVAAHLTSCSACRAALERLHRIEDLLKETPVPPVPVGLSDRILAATRKVAASQTRSNQRGGQRVRAPLQTLAAASILVAVVSLGGFMGWQTAGNPPAASTAGAPGAGDPVALFHLEQLGSAPPRSLPEAYQTLVSARRPGE